MSAVYGSGVVVMLPKACVKGGTVWLWGIKGMGRSYVRAWWNWEWGVDTGTLVYGSAPSTGGHVVVGFAQPRFPFPSQACDAVGSALA